VRFSVRPRGLIRPRVRGFVRSSVRPSGRPVLRRRGHAGPRSHLQARRRPRQVRLGVYGFENLSPAPAEFAAEAVLIAYTLMACGRGRDRRLQRHHRQEMETLWSRRSPAPPPSAARRRKPKSPASGEAVRAGSRDPALPPHSSLPDGPAGGRTPPVVKTRGGLKKTGRRPLRLMRERIGTDKKALDGGARTA
jgi:hypothetical protein